MRRLHVRGHENVLKRLLIQVSAFNLGMLMRQSLGVGTPRGLQGRICALMLLILSLFKRLKGLFGLIPAAWPEKPNSATPSLLPSVGTTRAQKTYFYHGLLGFTSTRHLHGESP